MKKRSVLELKRAALEMSIGTIVIIVLAMAMLILGMILVRSIMCGAIGLTGDVNTKVRGELNKLFQSSAEEVVCIGSAEEIVALIPGRVNTIYCSVDATEKDATYTINMNVPADISEWVVGESSWSKIIAPGDESPKKVLLLDIPENAPRKIIRIPAIIEKNGGTILSPDLDFEVKDVGFFTTSVC